MAEGLEFQLTPETVRRVKQRLQQVETRVAIKASKKATSKVMNVIRKRARANLRPHRDTGKLSGGLRTSVQYRSRQRRYVGFVRTGAKQFYGLFLEFGTENITPKRWLESAARDSAADANRIIVSELKRELRV